MRGYQLPAALAALTLGFPPAPAAGQARLSLAMVAGQHSADGHDFTGTKDAFGYEPVLRLRLLRLLHAGLGYHASDHGLTSVPEHLKISAVFGELTYALDAARLRLYAGARSGSVHESITIVEWTANGWFYGGVVGAEVSAIPHVAIVLQLTESSIHLGDRHQANGTTLPGTAATGTSLGIQGGIALRL